MWDIAGGGLYRSKKQVSEETGLQRKGSAKKWVHEEIGSQRNGSTKTRVSDSHPTTRGRPLLLKETGQQRNGSTKKRVSKETGP